MVSIYEKNGGYETFYKCVIELYKELIDHPEISYHFIGVDIEKLSKLQTQMLSILLGAEIDYTGRPLKVSHSDLSITHYQFNIVIRFFRYIFENNNFDKKDIKEIIKRLESQRNNIVTKKTAIIDKIMSPFYHLVDYCLKVIGRRRI